MVTGIEIAGVVLAAISLLVKQIDAFAAGVRLITALGNKSYARQLRGYAAHLGSEEVLLMRTFEILLDGIVDADIILTKSTRDQWIQLFEKQSIRTRLQHRLGRSCDPCIRTLQHIHDCLIEVEKKLGPMPTVCTKN